MYDVLALGELLIDFTPHVPQKVVPICLNRIPVVLRPMY